MNWRLYGFWPALSAGLVGALLMACNQTNTPKADGCDPSVDTITLPDDRGRLCGRRMENPQGESSHAYLGIPFAEAPVGPRRWAPPVAKAGLGKDLFQAIRFGDACIQPSGALKGYSGSEDCLFLNVYKPKTSGSDPLPVMVYIPGGGFIASQSPVELNGTAFANRGVIVVTTHYRLGSLGFMRYTNGNEAIEGNFGIQDQQLAMQWVKNNISAFGGDPDKITLFGESAGAMSVGLHLFSIPSSGNLFRAAIMESNIYGIRYDTAQTASEAGQSFVNLLCSSYQPDNCAADGAWLRSLTTEQIAQAELLTLPSGGMPGLITQVLTEGTVPWLPVVNVAPVLEQPNQGYSEGVEAKPYVFGVNRDEGAFFLAESNSLTPEQYRQILSKRFTPAQRQKILNYRENGRLLYAPEAYEPRPAGGLTPASIALARLQTDLMAAAPNLQVAAKVHQQHQANDIPQYGYHFTYRASFDFNGFLRCSEAADMVCHTDEIPFAWADLVRKNAEGGTIPVSDPPPSNADKTLAATMNAAWAGFAKDPLSGWGHPRFDGTPSSDVVVWNNPVGQGMLMPEARYSFWKPMLLP